MANESHRKSANGKGDGHMTPYERHLEEREQSTQYFMNENGFRFNRGKEGDLAWKPLDYTDDDYRFDNSQHIDYGERYGFAAYGKAQYDPDANRDWRDPRDQNQRLYNYTWSNDEPFNNREQDYRYHPDRYARPGVGNRAERHQGRGPKNYTRTDERIREDVSERLTQDGFVDASDMEVFVKDAEVSLRGTVADRAMKRRAEDIADSVGGVKDVRNELRLASSSTSAGSTSDNSGVNNERQHSVAQTEGARGGAKHTKTPHSGGTER